jgi:hypothetical protein
MSTSNAVQELARQAEQLSVSEQIELAMWLMQNVRAAAIDSPRSSWTEVAGIAPYPLTGEDAQAWVSRTREEGERSREQQSRRTQ